MANYCYTEYTINGTRNELVDLLDNIDKSFCREDDNPSGIGALGKLLINSGYTEDEVENRLDLNHRGYVDFYDYDFDDEEDSHLNFTVCSKWSPCNEMMYTMLKEKYPSLLDSCVFSAEEPGFQLFETNDPVLKDSYNIWLEDKSMDRSIGKEFIDLRFESPEVCTKEINEYLGTDYKSLDEANEALKARREKYLENKENEDLFDYWLCKSNFIELSEYAGTEEELKAYVSELYKKMDSAVKKEMDENNDTK